ncbi:ribonuclease H-like domain-containing protein [Bacillus shivajii]|uniref:ribonuclease H-like domain-containing protein n=1 Tax=Bacillus shivajii TaxID=1983719 RepID=UPI001CF9E62F|nr:ribonuclease H-like domain-containing protein [Bacillus shivajii]UCZ51504.1 ribonuclease H-like domain-containing protein [Bacillus shivajii]
MSLKSKLNRMKTHLNTEKSSGEMTGAKSKQNLDEDLTTQVDVLESEWRKLGFKPVTFDGEVSYKKQQFYPNQNHLFYQDMLQINDLWEELQVNHPLSLKGVAVEKLLFFDTETTGLSTGAGNTIFLIGYAKINANGIEVTQHILPDPASEAAFMYSFLQDFREDDYLVSYNGKSFDWPQVKSRHSFVRDRVPKLPKFGHIDLLHAARRLWKDELPSCRLAIVEENKLKNPRSNDTPGSMAPLLYFDYLQDKKPEHLKGIIEHNDKDVRSLVHLYIDITKRLFHQHRDKLTSNEHFQAGKWFEQTGVVEKALKHYECASLLRGHGQASAFYRLGLLAKKAKKTDEAKQFFHQSISLQAECFIESYIELAKLLEHQEKDIQGAYENAKHALAIVNKSNHKNVSISKVRDIEKRIARLKKKIKL